MWLVLVLDFKTTILYINKNSSGLHRSCWRCCLDSVDHVSGQTIWTATGWQVNDVRSQGPTPSPITSGISSAGAALNHLFHTTCDWSWSWISRLPGWKSTRSHQDRTGVAGAAAWIVLTTLLAKQSGQLLADKWMMWGHRAPPLHQSPLETAQLELPWTSSCTTCLTHVTGLGLGMLEHLEEAIRIPPEVLLEQPRYE